MASQLQVRMAVGTCRRMARKQGPRILGGCVCVRACVVFHLLFTSIIAVIRRCLVKEDT